MDFKNIIIDLIPFFLGFVLGSFFGIMFSASMNLSQSEIEDEEDKE